MASVQEHHRKYLLRPSPQALTQKPFSTTGISHRPPCHQRGLFVAFSQAQHRLDGSHSRRSQPLNDQQICAAGIKYAW